MFKRVTPLEMHRRGGSQKGQALLFIGIMFTLLIGVLGLAIDGAVAYGYSVAIERAASAGALAGVPYMPDQFAPPPVGTAPANFNAVERAMAEVKRNGFDYNDTVSNVVAKKLVCCDRTKDLKVTVTATVPTFFMEALGVQPFVISRTAIAGYRPPIALGQPGSKLGSTTSELGTGGQFYFNRFKGWNDLRSEGDAFTPNPKDNNSGGSGTSTDVHQISAIQGQESSDVDCNGGGGLALPCRGGYNFRVVVGSLPAGSTAEMEVYNAAYAPDFSDHTTNGATDFRARCENSRTGGAGTGIGPCNANAEYNYHEDDNGGSVTDPGQGNAASKNYGAHCDPAQTVPRALPCNQGINGQPAAQTKYNAVGYTFFQVPDIFLRSSDKVMTQTKVFPIDATNWDGDRGNTGPGSTKTPVNYVDVANNTTTANQTYDGSGNPTNMRIFHSWVDINNYTESADANLVKRTTKISTSAGLGTGTYRLRVDSLSFDGTLTNNGNASKGYAARIMLKDASGTLTACATCHLSAWEDMCVYTPIASGTGVVPIFQLTKDYAGATIDVDIFDVGDSGGIVNLAILDPSGAIADSTQATPSQPNLVITNMGINRNNPAGNAFVAHVPPQDPIPKNTGVINHNPVNQGKYEAANNPGYSDANGNKGPEYQGSWIRITIPISDNYNPGLNDYWSIQYVNTAGANDTFTLAVSARGGPVHLLSN